MGPSQPSAIHSALGNMTDGDLRFLAADLSPLTEVARSSLAAELVRRGIRASAVDKERHKEIILDILFLSPFFVAALAFWGTDYILHNVFGTSLADVQYVRILCATLMTVPGDLIVFLRKRKRRIMREGLAQTCNLASKHNF